MVEVEGMQADEAPGDEGVDATVVEGGEEEEDGDDIEEVVAEELPELKFCK